MLLRKLWKTSSTPLYFSHVSEIQGGFQEFKKKTRIMYTATETFSFPWSTHKIIPFFSALIKKQKLDDGYFSPKPS